MRYLLAEEVRVRCIVTSPPYFGLRDYGHEAQLGLEETPEHYVASMVEVFRAARDLLTDDGTLWLNIGDTYAGQGGRSVMSGKEFQSRARGRQEICRSSRVKPTGEIKSKDLIGIPWMLAFALRADGWYLRQEIIWHKSNPMPESVTDRCTKAHESIFLLTKSDRYFFDAKAIAQPLAKASQKRLAQNVAQQTGSDRVPGKSNGPMKAVGPRFGGDKYGDDSRMESRTKSGNGWDGTAGLANRRSVWTIATTPFKGAHFAVMPEELVEPCILAGSRAGDIVFDPFMGSGTVAAVAQRLGRHWLGAELNPKYIALQAERTRQTGLMLEVA
ncbi:DNA-methyltransferase [Ralstonia syzygii]|nr:site-specific DNA-methyltransferase [Ralstonia syzygii]